MSKKILVLLVCLSALASGHHAAAATKSTVTGKIPVATVTSNTNTSIEQKVRTYFKDTPAMAEIARCESGFRQFADSGTVLRSDGMIGVFQFYEDVHAPAALKLGYDLATVDGNLAYAKHLYDSEGTTPWNGSKGCWNSTLLLTTPTKAPTAAATITAADRARLLEKIATLTKLIVQLQKQLALKQALAHR
jgi:hypothetical protein